MLATCSVNSQVGAHHGSAGHLPELEVRTVAIKLAAGIRKENLQRWGPTMCDTELLAAKRFWGIRDTHQEDL